MEGAADVRMETHTWTFTCPGGAGAGQGPDSASTCHTVPQSPSAYQAGHVGRNPLPGPLPLSPTASMSRNLLQTDLSVRDVDVHREAGASFRPKITP